MVVGSLPGQFTITNFGYESMTGAPIAVGAGMPVPGPGGVAVLGAAALVARRRRR
jgi:MYXO-CTERM domain-containing protein